MITIRLQNHPEVGEKISEWTVQTVSRPSQYVMLRHRDGSEFTFAYELSNLSLSLSPEALRMLEHLASIGIYGQSPAEVALRFVDKELVRMLEHSGLFFAEQHKV